MAHPGMTPITLDADGAGVARFGPNLANLTWSIAQVTVAYSGTSQGVISVHVEVNDVPCTSKVTALTPVAASRAPAIDLGGHDTMKVVVENGRAAGNLVVTYFYDETGG